MRLRGVPFGALPFRQLAQARLFDCAPGSWVHRWKALWRRSAQDDDWKKGQLLFDSLYFVRGRSRPGFAVLRVTPSAKNNRRCFAAVTPPLSMTCSRGDSTQRRGLLRYSVITRSAHSTSDTKIVGLPNFAPQWSRSVCSTARARLQAPQA